MVRRNPRHLVVRTSLNHGESPTADRGFNEEIRNAWKAGRVLRLFTDEYRNPLASMVTARALWELLAQEASGILHVAGAERLSRWEIGKALAGRYPGVEARIEPGSLRDYHGAPRAPDTSLDCTRAQSRLSFPLPGYRAWLAANP